MFPILAQAQPGQFNRVVDSIARTPLSKIVILVLVLTVLRLAIAPYLKSVAMHRRSGVYSFARFANETLDAIIYAGVFVFLLIRPFAVQMFQIPTGSMLDTLQIGDFIVANKAVYRYSEPKVGDIVVFRPPKGAIQDPTYIDEDGQVNQDFIKRCVGVPGDVVEVKDGKLWRNGKVADEPFVRVENGSQNIENYYKLVHYTGTYAPFRDKFIPVDAEAPFSSYPRVNYASNRFSVGFDYGIGTLSIEKGLDGNLHMVSKSEDELTPEERQLSRDLCDLPPAPIPKGFFLMMGDNRNGSFDSRFWGLVPRSAVIGRAEFVVWPMARWRRAR